MFIRDDRTGKLNYKSTLEIVGTDKVQELYHSFVGFNNLNFDMVWKVSLELK